MTHYQQRIDLPCTQRGVLKLVKPKPVKLPVSSSVRPKFPPKQYVYGGLKASSTLARRAVLHMDSHRSCT